jgi:hypothetical protein
MEEVTILKRSRRQWQAEARLRVAKGEAGSLIGETFVQQGLDPKSAEEIVCGAQAKARSRAIWLLVVCLSLAGLGILVTVASFANAAHLPEGGTYFIWFGPVIAGAAGALVAIGRLDKIR